MSSSILEDYKAELAIATSKKAEGQTHVSANVAGPVLAKGRFTVPIDEYIKHWEDGIAAMEAGADQEQFNY